MSEERNEQKTRRRFLEVVGSSAVLVPLIGVSGCSKRGEDAPAVQETAPSTAPVKGDAADALTDAAESAEAAVEDAVAAEMPKLAEDDAQAKALAYKHDARTVDSTQQPRYQAGQACDNCALYQGADGDTWGGCSIFPGKLVNADGWCNVYAPLPG